MDLNLKGKTALITGSYRGTGQKIASILSKEGASVIVHGFEEEKVKESAIVVNTQLQVTGDITTDQGAEKVAAAVFDLVGHVDILINNYGTAGFGNWLTTSSEDWIDMYQKNTLSAVRLIKLFVPEMKQNHFGRIIQISTIGATCPNKIMPHYYASKGALTNLTVSLAKELKNTGITVNTVSPGLIKTEELELYYREKAGKKGWGDTWEEIEQQIVTHDFPNPVGRIARREDIGNLVAFLCSHQAGFINGQDIHVDGGHLGIV
ncbi:SDR family oxidoreductase [bacterium]|nr:SDR family oxidoreductase [bacterium]